MNVLRLLSHLANSCQCKICKAGSWHFTEDGLWPTNCHCVKFAVGGMLGRRGAYSCEFQASCEDG